VLGAVEVDGVDDGELGAVESLGGALVHALTSAMAAAVAASRPSRAPRRGEIINTPSR
jgi:hypothetical protein